MNAAVNADIPVAMNAAIPAASPHVMNTYGRLPLALSHGQGCRVWDINGKVYLDALGGIAVNTLGHNHAKLVPALQDQLHKIIHTCNYFHVPDAERLAALLETGRAQARAHGMPVVWQTSSGGTGFEFAGLPPPGLPRTWLNSDTRAAPGVRVVLGPEPLIEPQALALSNATAPGKSLWVVTDGLRPFRVQSTPDTPGARP